jgi:hypothetical protein
MDKKYRALVLSNPSAFISRVKAYAAEGSAA